MGQQIKIKKQCWSLHQWGNAFFDFFKIEKISPCDLKKFKLAVSAPCTHACGKICEYFGIELIKILDLQQCVHFFKS